LALDDDRGRYNQPIVIATLFVVSTPSALAPGTNAKPCA
jgi:hypothetical protein